MDLCDSTSFAYLLGRVLIDSPEPNNDAIFCRLQILPTEIRGVNVLSADRSADPQELEQQCEGGISFVSLMEEWVAFLSKAIIAEKYAAIPV